MDKKQLIILGSAVVVAFGIGYFVGGSSATGRANKNLTQKTNSQTTSNASKEDVKKEEKKEDKTYKVGDTIKADKYEVTINKVYLTDYRNEYHEKKFEKVAMIEYTYKNLNSDKDLFIDGTSNFKVYDEEGNALATYPARINQHPQRIAKGKQCAAEVAYGFNKGPKLELQFYSNTFNNKADAKVILEIQ